jgi:hypothetical protein
MRRDSSPFASPGGAGVQEPRQEGEDPICPLDSWLGQVYEFYLKGNAMKYCERERRSFPDSEFDNDDAGRLRHKAANPPHIARSGSGGTVPYPPAAPSPEPSPAPDVQDDVGPPPPEE